VHVLLYDDAAEYGGHEVMTVEGAKQLSRREGVKVSFVFFEGNARLSEHITEIAGHGNAITLHPIPFRSGRMQSVATAFSPRTVRKIRETFSQIGPDMVVLAQGTIEISSLGLLAAKRNGMRTISYIPIPHTLTTMGVHLGRARDAVNRYFYALPDNFITISEGMKQRIVSQHVSPERVRVVHNAIDVGKHPRHDRTAARSAFGLRQQEWAIGVIGRVQFRHKGQDVFIRAIAAARCELGSFKAFIVGDGPDMKSLLAMIGEAGLGDVVRFLSWSDDLSKLYCALDVVVIPSRFEGVPLVMLEAMHYELPIVASSVDGMSEFLPKSWLCVPGDGMALGQVLASVRNSDSTDQVQRNRRLVEQVFTMERFADEFCGAVLGT